MFTYVLHHKKKSFFIGASHSLGHAPEPLLSRYANKVMYLSGNDRNLRIYVSITSVKPDYMVSFQSLKPHIERCELNE